MPNANDPTRRAMAGLAASCLALFLVGCEAEEATLDAPSMTASAEPEEEMKGFNPNRPPPDWGTPASKYPDPPNWGAPATLDPAIVPNPYVNLGIGVSIARPESFVWLPESSMPDFLEYKERIDITKFDAQMYADPIQQPLISMASRLDPQWGRDIVAFLYARPVASDLKTMVDYFPAGPAMIPHILNRRAMLYSGFEVLEEPVFEEIDDQDGATTRARYDVPDPDGTLLPTTELVWLARIGRYLIYLNIIYPENADAPTLEQVKAIADSLRIDV
jgi:hypothetical protein